MPPAKKKIAARPKTAPKPGAPPSAAWLNPLGRALALLGQGGTGARRELYQLLLREALSASACREGSLLLGPAGDLRLEAVQGLGSEVWAGDPGDVVDPV